MADAGARGDDCLPILATHPDSFVYFRLFAPFSPRRGRPDADDKWQLTVGSAAERLQRIEEHEAEADGRLVTLDAFLRDGRRALRGATEEAMKAAYDGYRATMRAAHRSDGPRAALRLAEKFLADHPDLTAAQARPGRGPRAVLQAIGVMFEERLRVRAIGYTIERAPFHKIWLGRGSRRTLRERAFTRRLQTLERALEDQDSATVEYSSSYSTEFVSEFAETLSTTTGSQQGLSIGGAYNGVSGNLSGSSTDAVTETTGRSESTRLAREAAQRAQSTKTSTHKIAFSNVDEAQTETESTHLLVNDRENGVHYLLHRVMQVMHCSHERYGAWIVWAPLIADLGTLLRQRFATRWNEAERDPGMDLHSEEKAVPGPMLGGIPALLRVTVPAGYDPDLDSITLQVTPPAITSSVSMSRAPSWNPAQRSVTVALVSSMFAAQARARFTIHVEPTAEAAQSSQDVWIRTQMLELQANPGRFSELVSTVLVEEAFASLGLRDALGDVVVQQTLRRLFALEAVTFDLLPRMRAAIEDAALSPAWFSDAGRPYIPLRTEAVALALSLVLGNGGASVDWDYADLGRLVQESRAVIQRYADDAAYDEDDRAEIDAPDAIHLTERGEAAWRNDFEHAGAFDVMSRFVVTVPTNGIHASLQGMEECLDPVAPPAEPRRRRPRAR